MKCLFLFPLIFLLLSSTVSSQNPNMFEFTLSCHNQCRACDAIDLFNQAGQIISNNLVLNTKIQVYVVIYETPDTETLGSASPQIIDYVDPEDGVTRIYPLALVRQLDPNFKLDTLDIIMEVNSRRDDAFWFPNGESIEPNELDFLEFVLHELHHGLGIKTSWYQPKDDSIGVGLIPYLDYYFDGATGKFTFDGFYETVFDKFLVSMRSGAMIKTYTKALNDMAGPQGRNYNDLNDFFTQLRDKQNQEGKSYTMDMLEIATNQNRLGFLITTDDDSVNGGEIASEAIPLETTYNPPVIGKSIEHLGYDDYYNTDDFLFIPVMETGFTLQEQITANGDYPGGGVGPSLFIMLESIGYKLRLPPRRRKPPATIAKINK